MSSNNPAEALAPAALVPPAAAPSDVISAIKGNEFRFVPSNTHRLRTTLNELAITFGTITDPLAQNEKFGVYEHVCVSLTLGQVKTLVRELGAYIDEAEKLGAKFNVNEVAAQEGEDRARRMSRNVFSKLQPAQPEPEKPVKA